MKDTEEARPEVCHEGSLLRMWHKPSTRFDTPKAVIYLHFACPEVRPGNPFSIFQGSKLVVCVMSLYV